MTTPEYAQDMLVLATAARLLDEPVVPRPVRVPFEVEGLTEEQVVRSVRRLDRAQPPYWTTPQARALGQGHPPHLNRLTERGLREGGIWPTAESLVDQAAALLRDVGDQVGDPEQAGLLKRAAAVVGVAARDIAVGVASRQIGGL